LGLGELGRQTHELSCCYFERYTGMLSW